MLAKRCPDVSDIGPTQSRCVVLMVAGTLWKPVINIKQGSQTRVLRRPRHIEIDIVRSVSRGP